MKMNKKGFTLIELLAVIVILAVVALVATPIILASVKDAKKSAAIASANNVITAINYNEQMVNFDASGIVGSYTTAVESIATNVDGVKYTGQATEQYAKSTVKISGDSPKKLHVSVDSNKTVDDGCMYISGHDVKILDGKATDAKAIAENSSKCTAYTVDVMQ